MEPHLVVVSQTGTYLNKSSGLFLKTFIYNAQQKHLGRDFKL